MSETTVSLEQAFGEKVDDSVNDSSQIDAPQEVVVNSAEIDESSEPPHSVRKRRKRKRKRLTTDSQGMSEEGDNTTPDIGLVQGGFLSAFHGVVYDEEGHPKEITLRQDNMTQVNRKRQKRLGTCTFKISTEMEPKTTFVMPVQRGRYGTTSPSSNREKPKVNNLEMRIHKYENTHDNVVKYWYSTLDWIDKAAIELQQSEENEEYYEGGQFEEEGCDNNEDGYIVERAIEETINNNLGETNEKIENTGEEVNEGTNVDRSTKVKENTQRNANLTDGQERSPTDNQQVYEVKTDANRDDCSEEKVNIGDQITDQDANTIGDENVKTTTPETQCDL